MDFSFLLKGILTGMIIGAPLGPTGMVCMTNALKKGKLHGLFSGLGAATADGIYAGIIGFGLTYISQILLEHQGFLRIIGGVFLIYVGFSIIALKTSERKLSTNKTDFFGSYASTFFLSFTNPLTLFTFLALFAGLGIGLSNASFIHASILVLGVFIGSTSWWMVFIGKIDLIEHYTHIDSPWLQIFKKILGIAVIVTGILVMAGNTFNIIQRLMRDFPIMPLLPWI